MLVQMQLLIECIFVCRKGIQSSGLWPVEKFLEFLLTTIGQSSKLQNVTTPPTRPQQVIPYMTKLIALQKMNLNGSH
jgi:hypothetical protein